MRKVTRRTVIVALLVLGIAFITAGVSYAVFSSSQTGIKGNTITSGAVSFLYEDSNQGITLTDTMPMPDNNGMSQNNYFDFTITSETTSQVRIPYDITVRRKNNNASLDGAVKFYLTEVTNKGEQSESETALTLENNKTISKFSELSTYTNTALNITSAKNEKLLYTGVVPISTSNYRKDYRLRMWISDGAGDVAYQQVETGSCSDTTYTTEEACIAHNEDWTRTVEMVDQEFSMIVNVYAKGAEGSGTLLSKLNNLVASSDQVAQGNGYIQKQTVSVTPNAISGINNSTYTNIIYTGPNPNNFIEFNGEMWRIIGVYNEDTHGISDTQLVKIIRNDNLIISTTDGSNKKARWDKKTTADSTNGVNEWSTSQLMFMLNGTGAINKGKIYDGTPLTSSTTRVNGDYIEISDNGTNYYPMWKHSLGSYLSYDQNGESYKNKTIYTSSVVYNNVYDEKTAVIGSTLSSASQDLIQEINWHLGGMNSYQTTSDGLIANYYENERGNIEYSGDGSSTTSLVRSTMWTGKVGLMYVSDYAYATSGGNTDRFVCELYYPISNWYNIPPCSQNSWLFYNNATASSNGEADVQASLNNYANYYYTYYRIYDSGKVDQSNASESNTIRPVVYLKSNVNIVGDGSADGSYNNPYKIVYD